MRSWRTALPVVIVLAVGVVGGVVLAALLDDDPEVATDATTTTSTGAETTTSTAATSTSPPAESTSTSSTTSTTTTSTPSTTTTTGAPADPAPLADATTGELVGFPMQSAIAPVEAELVSRFGAPTTDTGWTAGCELGGPEIDERVVWWGGLRVRFEIVDGAEVVAGWSFADPARPPAPPSPDGPSGDDIVMPPGVAWGRSIAEVAAAIGASLDGVGDIQDVFGLTWVYDRAGDARWLAPGVSVDEPFSEVSWRAFDTCE